MSWLRLSSGDSLGYTRDKFCHEKSRLQSANESAGFARARRDRFDF